MSQPSHHDGLPRLRVDEQLAEDDVLRVLVEQAWELRGSPHEIDACQAIVDWHERRWLARFERQQEAQARHRKVIKSADRVLAALDALDARGAL
jgi:hypothetical protein